MVKQFKLAPLDRPPHTPIPADLHSEHDAWLALMAGDTPPTFFYLNREIPIREPHHTMWLTPHDEGD